MPPIDLNPDTRPPGDVAAALAYAEDHQREDTIDLGHGRILVRKRLGAGAETWEPWDTTDPACPARSAGTIHVYDARSFADAVKQRVAAAETVVYVDETTRAMTAVLNDDGVGTPQHRDYRVALALRLTPEWEAWVDGQGLGSQERFAERIEDGEPEIVATKLSDDGPPTPTAADMLEIAQTFHAASDVQFKSGTRLADGTTQLVFEENVQAHAGANGSLKVPEVFTLALAPFAGADLFRVHCKVRYRIVRQGNKAGELQIGYVMVRPDDVLKAAFATVTEATAELLDSTLFLAGPAPAPVR
jgi:uncharacterized protein YfdQ (DUF2303 family)